VAKQLDALGDLPDDPGPEEELPLLRKLAEAALALLLGIDGNLQRLSVIDRKLDLTFDLLDLPARLIEARETDLAVRVARALEFCAPDNMNGKIALAYARAGDRERALAQLLENLETATEPFIAEYEAGDVYRELAEADAAEVYYRRSLALAKTNSDRREATLRITSLLIDLGREADAAAFLAQQRAQPDADASTPQKSSATQLPSAGRNDPCPCGSGKKYKKCHGA